MRYFEDRYGASGATERLISYSHSGDALLRSVDGSAAQVVMEGIVRMTASFILLDPSVALAPSTPAIGVTVRISAANQPDAVHVIAFANPQTASLTTPLAGKNWGVAVYRATSQEGFALITAILLLVVILALGLGSLNMSEASLRMNENTQTKAIARSNAEAGLDAAILVANRDAAAGTFPTMDTFTAQPITVVAPTGTTTVTVASFTVDPLDSNLARIAVTGTGPGGARHTAEVLLGAADGSAPRVDPLFYRGLVAQGVVKISGGIAPIIAAEIHGDEGYSLEADFMTCVIRDTITGLCLSTELIAENFPLTAAIGISKYDCKITSNVGIVDPCFDRTPMHLVAPLRRRTASSAPRARSISRAGPSAATSSSSRPAGSSRVAARTSRRPSSRSVGGARWWAAPRRWPRPAA